MRMAGEGPLSGWIITDSLIVNNQGDGFSVWGNPSVPTPTFEVKNTAFWGNTGDAVGGGGGALGVGSVTDMKPVFISTDGSHPNFMHLDPANARTITHGAMDGGFMGARPVSQKTLRSK